VVGADLDAVREVGAMLVLQVQPGRASVAEIVKRWEALLSEPDVGILFDLRDHLALEHQRAELLEVARVLRDQHGADTPVLARGVDPSDAIVVPEFIDLRSPGAVLPHVAYRSDPRPRALVYQ
jgi:hypothetical protein